MPLLADIEKNKSRFKQWRHQLHAIPEIAFEEHKTANFIEAKLEEIQSKSTCLVIHPRMAGTGIIASISSGSGDKTIALRADIDALPIIEKNDIDYQSTHQGQMHACGHDGHSSMLLAAIDYLSNHPQTLNGTVYFIFQPAEENEGGGRKLVEEGFFKKYKIDAIYGMHNWPGIEAGKFAIKSGPVMAAYDVFDISIQGKGGHAAAPHQCVDPIIVSAQIISALQSIVSRNMNPLDACVLSITKIHSGKGYNVIPETASIAGTIRTFNAKIQAKIEAQLRQIVESTCQSFGAKASIDYQKRYPSTINNETETQQAFLAAKEIVGEENIIINAPSSMGSEDFSFLLNESKGCYVSIGNGDTASLHNDNYDFNDDILTTGASYWVKLTQMQLAID